MNPDLWFAFLVACLLISISPGAGAVNTMSNGLRYGVRRTLPAILGLQLGLVLQILVVGVGLGALLAASNTAFTLVKWLGVAYLVWLGYRKWTQPPLSLTGGLPADESQRRRFWQATLVNLTNPKATIFLLALFPQFLDAALPQAPQIWIMGTTLVGVDVLVMMGYATLAAQLARWMRSERHQRLQNRLFGGLFMGAAALMASYRHAA